MNQAIFHLKRTNYEELTTMGELLNPDGSRFGFTLEDVARPQGIKDKNFTAIPETLGDFTFMIGLRDSPKYGRVAVIYTEKNGAEYVLEYGGIKFKYILVHGGNDHGHTSGCVLLAKDRNLKSRKISGSLKKEFAAEIERLTSEGYDCRLRVTNLPQAQ